MSASHKNSDDRQEDQAGKTSAACAEMEGTFADNFGTTSENVTQKKSEWDPQVRSGALKIFPKVKCVVNTPF